MAVGHVVRLGRGRLVVLAAALLLPGWAAAQPQTLFPPTLLVPNYNRVFPGLDESIEAGASLVRAGTPPALWYNPSGLVLSTRTTVNASVQGYQITFLQGSNVLHGGTQESNLSTVPTFVGIVLGEEAIPLKNVRFGFGVNNPVSWTQGVNPASPISPATSVLYSVNSSFTQYQPDAAVAWAVSETFRLGFELSLPYTQLNTTGQLSGSMGTTTALTSSIRTASFYAYNFHIVPSVSFQWEALPWLGVGAMVQPPALRLLAGGNLTLTGLDSETITSPSLTRQQSFRDTSATFNYVIPAEVSGGVAFKLLPVEFELDVHWYVATGPYNLVSSSAPITVISGVTGVPPQKVISPFPTQVWGIRNVVDFNLGGSLYLSKLIKLLAGVYTDQAPGNVQSNVFQHITFYGVRAGIAFSSSHLSGSVGFGYERGSTSVPLQVNLPGAPINITQPLTFQTLSLLFALAYVF
ncbi:MAG: hypothetical protein ACLQDQ_16170 [Myxococcaceae bacterium]